MGAIEENFEMKTTRIIIPVAALLLFAGQAAAQDDEEQRAAAKSAAAQMEKAEAREAELEYKMQQAERQMAEAARQIAELTSERLPQLHRLERRIEIMRDGRPRLGVTIGDDAKGGPVEGVHIIAVTPGSAASDAGLRAGDVITAVNDESLSAAEAGEANRKLLDFMAAIEEGDILDVEYLRDGKVGKVEIEPRAVNMNFFAFRDGPGGHKIPAMPDVHIAPHAFDGLKNAFTFSWLGNVWADMELVELNEGLGKYFGTDSGLLVVSAPESSALQLEDGDVIKKIDGREPTSVRHAIRIFSSYQPGETLKLEIRRDKKRRTLDITMPDERSSWVSPHPAPVRPASVPMAPRPAARSERT